MDYRDALLIFTIILNSLLALVIFLKNRRSWVKISFASFTLSIAVWTFLLLVFRVAEDEQSASWWMKSSYIVAVFIASLFWLFALKFPEKRRLTTFHKILIIVPGLAMLALLFSPDFLIERVEHYDWGKEVIVNRYHHLIFAVYFLFFFFGGIAIIWRKYKRHSGITKIQLLYVFLIVLSAGSLSAFFNLLLPSPWILGTHKYIWLGPLFTAIFVICIAYTIAKYRFLDIRVVLKGGLVYSVLIFTIVGFFAFTVLLFGNFFQNIFQLNFIITASIITFVIALLFQPLAKILFKGFDRAIFKDAIKYKYSIKVAKEVLKQNFELKKLRNDLKRFITYNFGLSGFVFCALRRKNDRFEEVLPHDELKKTVYLFSHNDPFIQSLKLWPENIIIREEVPYILDKNKFSSEQKEALKNIEARAEETKKELILKISYDDELIGIIFCGERQEKKAYSKQDTEFLKDILKEADSALAIVLNYAEAIERAGIGG